MEEAIRFAAVQTNEDLIRRFGAFEAGVCFEMVLWTKEGLCLLHLGDGQAFCQKPEGVESLNFAPHHPPNGGKVGGLLAVNHSWGDEEIRQIVGEEALSPFPNIRFLSWEQLEKQGITALFLTTDGLLGQTVPSVLHTDYSIFTPWETFANLDDGTELITQDGDVEFDLPQ
ncbi:MAG: hypothetical protein AAB791_03440, partial [Patescibacteria group bacterium]